MNRTLDILITVFFGYNAGYYNILGVLYIAGLFLLFRKSQIKPWWALVPCFREYMLAKCAGNAKAGRVLFFMDIVSTAIFLVGERIEIASFSVPAAAIKLAVYIVILIFKIRVYKALTDVYKVSRKWVLAWVFAEWITALIWGISPKFKPSEEADVLVPENALQEEIEIIHTWFRDLGANFKRLFSFFAFGGDWKSLPIAIVITAIVASVARKDFFSTMDGTIKGSLALTCIAIWNGCFNSITTVSRERKDIRKMCSGGMKVSSYIVSIFIYQLVICLVQTVLTIYTCHLIGISFPHDGLFVSSLMVEIGFTMFLITFGADLMSLTISALVKDSVAAMTIMPFVLVVQLVFSGSVINVSTWNHSISRYTISNYGVKCIASQADYNRRPMMLAWNTLQSIKDTEVGTVVNLNDVLDAFEEKNATPAMKELRATKISDLFSAKNIEKTINENKALNAVLDRDLKIETTVGDILDMLQDEKRFPAVKDLRAVEINKSFTVREIKEILDKTDAFQSVKDDKIIYGLFTVESAIELVMSFFEDKTIDVSINVGKVMDSVLSMDDVVKARDKKPFEGMTLRKILNMIGLENISSSLTKTLSDPDMTVGQFIDGLLVKEEVKKLRNVKLDFTAKIGEIIDLVGEARVKDFLITNTTEAATVDEYDHTKVNIAFYWKMLSLFILIFAFTSIVSIAVSMKAGNKKTTAVKR